MKLKSTIDVSLNFKDLDVENAVQRELKDTASEIEKQAKANAPVLTGNLRNSITSDVKGLEANIGTDCEYAGYVHDGTYRMPARPFLDSAAEKELDGIEDRIADIIARLL